MSRRDREHNIRYKEVRQNMTSGDVWGRLLFMILFAVIFSVARAVLGFVVVFQFFWILFAGAANEPLLRFGKNLTVYVNELLEFQTFNAETKPFPFSPWPDEEPGGEIWLDDELDDDLDTMKN